MKKFLLMLALIGGLRTPLAAQQNWAAIPCSKMPEISSVDLMFVDSLHNDIIICSTYGYSVCNTTYKGIVGYNSNGFHDLNYGINKHRPGNFAGGALVTDCITYGNKTLFGGGFRSVGSDTLYAQSVALWDGAIWDTFPKYCFPNTLENRGGVLYGFLKHGGKLLMYGGFDTIGGVVSKNLAAFDGNTFTNYPTIPVSDNSPITKMIVYKNKLIATGNFYDIQNQSMFRLAQYDGTDWTSVGNGVQGGLSSCWTMEVYKDTLYIAGSFPKDAGNAGNYIMKWDGNQLYDAGFGDFCYYGSIRSLIPYRGRLYAFGNFMCAANQRAFGIAYYENGVWTVPQDSLDNIITSAVIYNNDIYIGGGFTSINGDTTIQKFAKLVCPDFDAASGCVSAIKESSRKLDLKIFPNPSSDKINIQFEQSTAIDKLTISNTLGQEVYKLMKPGPNQEIDVSKFPEGIYFLKAESRQGQGVFKVMKE